MSSHKQKGELLNPFLLGLMLIMPQGPSKRHAVRMNIKTLWELGWNDTEISRKVGCSRKTAYNWTSRFAEQEVGEDVSAEELVLSQPRSGAPKKISPSDEKKIVRYTKGKRKRSIRKTAAVFEISKSSMGRVLHKHGLFPYRRRKQPLISPAQATKRRKFARNYKDHDWESTLFTDESDFLLFPETNSQNDRVWTDDADEVPPNLLVKHSAGVKVWGGVSATGRTKLHFYEGTIGASEYIKILKKAKAEMGAIPWKDKKVWTFQHDGASAHKAKKTNVWLKENTPNFITSGPTGDWPGNSPDLNYIENVWAIMKEQLEENPPTSIDALKKRLRKIWQTIPQETLLKMAQGMRQRLKDVLRNEGLNFGK